MKKHRHRLSILMMVVGPLSLMIGAFFALAALARYEHERDAFYRLAIYFAAAGALVLLLRFLFIVLPDLMNERRSGVAARRKELARQYKRPVPTAEDEKSREGSVLLFVLVLLGIIAGTATYAIVAAQASEKETRAELEAGRLRLAAIDTARIAMSRLADDPDLAVDHGDEAWAKPLEFVDPSGLTRLIRVRDAQGLFDLNNVAVERGGSGLLEPREIAANILVQCGQFQPGAMVDALADWIDGDTEGVYESGFYAERGTPMRIPDRPLHGWEEVPNIAGWAPNVFRRKLNRSQKSLFESDVLDCFTVIPVARERAIPVNINTASPGVLQGLLGFAGDGAISRILRRRAVRPYRDVLALANTVDRQTFERVRPYVTVNSEYFHIDVRVVGEDGTADMRLLASRNEDGTVRAVEACF